MKVSFLIAHAFVTLGVLTSLKAAHAQWQMPSIITNQSHIDTGSSGVYYADISPSVSESYAQKYPVGSAGSASCEVGGGFTRNYYFPAQAGQIPTNLTLSFGARLTGNISGNPGSNLITSNAVSEDFEFREDRSGMYGGYDVTQNDVEYYVFDESSRGHSASVEYNYTLATTASVSIGASYQYYEHYGNRAKVEFSVTYP